MFLTTLVLMAAAPFSAPSAQDPDARLTACLDLATGDPAKGEATAIAWRDEGGGFHARQCLGVALANQRKWVEAGEAFEVAAQMAENAGDDIAPDFWAQAGNAWLAAGDPHRARAALDSAILSGKLNGLKLGEVYLDRARAQVAAGDPVAARVDLDRAIADAPGDPLAWLLSATLARRENDLRRADKDITEALRLSPEDPSVQLEAGNIAVMLGDIERARSAWEQVIDLAPGSPQANAAREALSQFGPER